ncbi:MAG: hypothetical protein ACK4MQ_01140 [Hyphomonas sp.]
MKSILLSVQPEFVEKIFSGQKRIELRRRFIRDASDIDYLFIYCTAPISAIVGSAIIERVEELTIEKIVDERDQYTGIDRERATNYFDGLETGFAIWLSSVQKLKENICMDELPALGVKRPPQSYSYVSTNVICKHLDHEDLDRHQYLHSGGGRRRSAA